MYRICGDEFTVILTGTDYENGIELLQAFDRQVEYNLQNGLTVVSAGYARYDAESDASFSDVFKRADEMMYQRKRYLKGSGARISAPVQSANASPAYNNRAAYQSIAPAAEAKAKETGEAGGDILTIECGGVQIQADSNVTSEKLNSLIDALRS